MELVIVFVILIHMWIFSEYYMTMADVRCETKQLQKRIRDLEKELSKYREADEE